jgi:hypothetical protein
MHDEGRVRLVLTASHSKADRTRAVVIHSTVSDRLATPLPKAPRLNVRGFFTRTLPCCRPFLLPDSTGGTVGTDGAPRLSKDGLGAAMAKLGFKVTRRSSSGRGCRTWLWRLCSFQATAHGSLLCHNSVKQLLTPQPHHRRGCFCGASHRIVSRLTRTKTRLAPPLALCRYHRRYRSCCTRRTCPSSSGSTRASSSGASRTRPCGSCSRQRSSRRDGGNGGREPNRPSCRVRMWGDGGAARCT